MNYFIITSQKPFLYDDEDFINEYNDLCTKFQKETLNLNIKYLNNRILIIDDRLKKIKENLIITNNLSYSDANTKFDELLDTNEKKLRRFYN